MKGLQHQRRIKVQSRRCQRGINEVSKNVLSPIPYPRFARIRSSVQHRVRMIDADIYWAAYDSFLVRNSTQRSPRIPKGRVFHRTRIASGRMSLVPPSDHKQSRVNQQRHNRGKQIASICYRMVECTGFRDTGGR
jgi:hypothetical protein